MDYIVSLHDRLTKSCRKALDKIGALITYESKYVPVIGIKTDTPWDGDNYDFIREIRVPYEGVFENLTTSSITFQPTISEKLLTNNNLIGWGSKIAFLDSGANDINKSIADHIDLTGTGIIDTKGHGTVVAKIIKNFAKGSLLYSVKIGKDRPDEINMMKGIEWAIENEVNVVNISSSIYRDPRCKSECDLCQLINVASDFGIAIVVAAGNRNSVTYNIQCPGIATKSITVGAIDQFKRVAEFSCIDSVNGSKPDIVAPGYCVANGSLITGTSLAAPIVAGVIGAIRTSDRHINDTVQYIYSTADDTGYPRYYQGNGALNIDKLVGVVKDEKVNCKVEGQEIG
ncbi:S8 family peptidase [Sporomusa sphaeroides]|uniref:Thermostable alkaline protease n=1 Tax=Sporomusa sphaeroides DSM 2875 TaxID=1337886 RepID=A0ABM9W3H3_9FIRM|nr:S8 family serine peptidase [Sporomusa sphaeroides]OLS56350.1 subtilisin BL [Sporomusa sphaeroides DSM 2875]CVK18445.1 Thermostable alkaline protease precursor [Sporomusa sphaeroides DSM 2875]